MGYVLESEREFERLEKQSTLLNYDYHVELQDLKLSPGAEVLDAGCGSGVVSRYLAQTFPTSLIHGCDLSEDRVERARTAARGIPNLAFDSADLSSLPFPTGKFNVVVCRYVLHHLKSGALNQIILNELFRVLKPGGRIWVIDTDGLFTHIYPQSAQITDVLEKFKAVGPVDFHMGRKLPSMLLEAGFEEPKWRIIPFDPRGDAIQSEIAMMEARLEAVRAPLTALLQDKPAADGFIEEYLATLRRPGTVYAPSRYVVDGSKPVKRALKSV